MRKSVNGPLLIGGASVGLAGIAAAVVLASGKPGNEEAAQRVDDAPVQPTQIAQTNPAPPAPTGAVQPPRHDPFVIKRILPIDGPIKYGSWHWDDSDVPDGPIVITVDLDARVLSIFQGGYEIGATAVLLGTQEKPTPTGTFPITQKKRHHVSNLYDAPMPYMQRLTNDGISLHASEVEWGYASHGCIGMPEAFAAKVFSRTSLGDRVFITRGKMVGLGDSLVDS